ncbi:hypothetical protein RJ639_047350 [Escallonia herrerae]|uniref:Helicase C-terminal domain-containing protein n=1 Tax=Escallonia herrerae TaxID=1293975 RepID=A0AA88W777_9ASTE|nr:hypothetical protein RJ639_047350 [Escallonia herrerae]
MTFDTLYDVPSLAGLFAMTEQRVAHHGRGHDKWVICPTCRQHTDFGDIAFVDDEQNKSCNSSFQGCEGSEASIKVQVTRRILWITSRNPKGKVLVFSSWNDVLDVLEHALTANNTSHIRMKGSSVGKGFYGEITCCHQHFKGESSCKTGQSETKSIQVLLLLIQHGANGLNLLEAQHVILVESLLNPAAEAQAISRVKETVEESIYKLNKSRSTSSFISGNKKNKDQPLLTLKDVESLFRVAPSTVPESSENPTGSLMHLPPSVAAAIAAERRLMERPTYP